MKFSFDHNTIGSTRRLDAIHLRPLARLGLEGAVELTPLTRLWLTISGCWPAIMAEVISRYISLIGSNDLALLQSPALNHPPVDFYFLGGHGG